MLNPVERHTRFNLRMMSLFDRLFSKSKPIEFSESYIELHSHLIPGIDDGVKELSESLEILRVFESQGIGKVITTPHIMPGYYDNTPEIIQNGLAGVKTAAMEAGLAIQVEAAAEYYVDDQFLDRFPDNDLLTFGDQYLLFELPVYNPPPNLDEILFELRSRGYKPVLAHPERYAFLFDGTLDKFERLHETGLLFQLNLFSATGFYSPTIKDVARRMIKAGLVDFVGSDIHNPRQLPVLVKATQERWNKQLFMNNKLLNHAI
jgi:tyrosine-protein phosphatase YwqE